MHRKIVTIMKNKLFTLLFALLASTTLFAIGRNDGSSQANAMDCSFEYSLEHPSGAKWYHLSSGVNPGSSNIAIHFSAPSACDLTIKLYLLNKVAKFTANGSASMIIGNTDYIAAEEVFFVVYSTGSLNISAGLTNDPSNIVLNSTIADTYDMAQDATFTLGEFDVVYTNGAYCYIQDRTGSGLIYKANYGLQAGDHVEEGLVGKIKIYYGLYEIIPTTAKADLTITPGEAFEPAEAYEIPSVDNVNQYVVYKNVSFAADTAFVATKSNGVYGAWNGKKIYFYNKFLIGASLDADKLYNITACNSVYNATPQACPVAVEEVTAEEPCETIYGDCGDNLTWELTCDSVLTISGSGAMWGALPTWAPYKEQIKIAILPDGIDSIAPKAFYNCTNLATVNMPNSVRALGTKAFVGCDRLTEPVYNEHIFGFMPRNYSGTYTVPEGIVSIAAYAFAECVDLTEITLPSSVLRLGINALGATFLTKITCYAAVPPTCNTNAFKYYMEDTGVTVSVNTSIPVYVPAESLTAYQTADQWSDFTNILPIGDEPETPCTTLSGTCGENLTWELTCDSVLTISGTGAMTDFANRAAPWYENRLAIRTLQIGNEVTTIGTYAFTGCSELTSITLGDNITSVGQRAFRDCSNIRTVTIGKNVVALGNGVFNNCNRIEAVQWNAINFRQQKPNQDENSFPFYASRNTITSFTFGEEVEYIPAYLMKDYAAIQQITIPASVTEIGDYAFANDSFVTYMHSPIQAITCYAVTPPTVYAATFMGIDKSACTLYVPYASIGLYRNAYQWSEFFTILPIEEEPVEPDPTYINVNYLDQAGNLFAAEYVALHLPVAPIIEGFSFLKWQVVAGDLEDGIVIQAVYSANEPSSAPEVYTNPANHAQKLIRNGHVYILKDDKVYTIHGQKVK